MKENNIALYFLTLIATPACVIFLLTQNFLRGGLLFLLIPILLFVIISPKFRLYSVISTFFIQNISFQKGNLAIFPIDIVFIFISFYYVIVLANKKISIVKFDRNLKNLFILYLIFSSICMFSFLCNFSNYDYIELVTSLFYIARMMQLLLVIYFISITKISYKLIETIFDTVIVWALFQLPFGLMQISKGIDMSGTLTAHHGYLGTMLIIPFFLSLYKLYDSLKTKCHKLTSVYYGIASVLILYMIFGTGCRSSLVGLSASLFLFIINFILKKDLKKVLTVLVLFTILIFISIKFTPAANIIDKTFHSSETNGNIDISSLSRLLIWKYTLLNFIQFPLITKIIGIGMGTFAFLEQHFVLWAGSSKFSGAHLNVLHILVETGILGLACFLMMFLYKIISLYYLRYYRLAQMTILMTLALLFSGVSQETFWFQSSFGTIYLFYITILTFVFKQLNNLSLTAVKEKCNY